MIAGGTVGSGRPTRRKTLESQLYATLRCAERLRGTDGGELRLVVADIVAEQLAAEEQNASHDLADADAPDLNQRASPDAAMFDEPEPEPEPLPDDARTSPGLTEFLRRVIGEATKGRALPTPSQVALSFIAFCYVKQVPYVETYTLTALAAEMGCSYAQMHKLVARWAAALGVPIPHGKGSSVITKP